MESQMHRPTAQEHPETVAEHGEKKSVLKKVKDKAKKIKKTILKHGHGQSDAAAHGAPQDETHAREVEDFPQPAGPKTEDITKPDAADAREVHAPPPAVEPSAEDVPPSDYQSGEAAASTGGQEAAVKPATSSDVLLEEDPNSVKYTPPSNYQTKAIDTTDQGGKEEADVDSLARGVENPSVEDNESKIPAEEEQTQYNESQSLQGQEQPRSYAGSQEHISQPAVTQALSSDVLEEDPHSFKDRPEDIPPSNYQTKAVDPTGQGGDEADVDSSLTQGLNNVSVGNEQTQFDESKFSPGQDQPRSYTGSHDQFAPQSTAVEESLLPQSHPVPEDFDQHESMPQDTTIDRESPDNNTVESSNLNQEPSDVSGTQQQQKKPITETAAEYKNMVAEKLTPVFEKVGGATVLSKAQGSGTEEQPPTPQGGEDEAPAVESSNQNQESSNVSAQQKKPLTETAAEYKNMVAEKLTPVIDKVGGATVLSKARGSGTEEQPPRPQGDEVEESSNPTQESPDVSGTQQQQKKPITETAAEYKNMVGEKLTPVIEKVGGPTVLSKVWGSGTEEQPSQGAVDEFSKGSSDKGSLVESGNQTQDSSDVSSTQQQKKPITETAAEYKNVVAEKLNPVYEKVSGAGTTVLSKVLGSGTEEQQRDGDEANKGSSPREYLSDKFKPGDEDKALSKAIAEKLQVRRNDNENEARDENKAANGSSPGVISSLIGSWLGGTKSAAARDDQSPSHGSEGTVARDEANVERKVEQ